MLEGETRGGEAHADGRAGQDGPEPGLVERRGHLPDPRLQVELRDEPPDRIDAAQGEEAGESQDQDDLDQREALPAHAAQYSFHARTRSE